MSRNRPHLDLVAAFSSVEKAAARGLFTCVNAVRSSYTEDTLGMYRGGWDGAGLFVAGFNVERREEKDGKKEEAEGDEWGAPRPGDRVDQIAAAGHHLHPRGSAGEGT